MRLSHQLSRASGALSALIGSSLFGRQLHFVLFVLCLSLAACHGDRRESFYPSLVEAKKDGAIDRGWIPDFLPESSRDIHELHDMSPSTTWCAFEFLPSESQSLRKNLKSIDVLPPSVSRVANPGKSWWPDTLVGNLDVGKIHGAGFQLSTMVAPETPSTNEVLLFAVDWTKGRVFFYRTRQPDGQTR